MTSKVTALLRAPGVVDPGRVDDAGSEHRDPEVPEKAKRRTFTANYKLEILAEYDNAPDGAKGALLRREGLLQPYPHDRPGRRPTRRAHRRAGCVRRRKRVAGRLLPAAPRQPATRAAGADPAPPTAATACPERPGAAGDPRRAAQRPVRRHVPGRGVGHAAR